MFFADIHCHVLACTDDGPGSVEEMYALTDAVYRDGTRLLCLTPHYHPGYYDDNTTRFAEATALLSTYTQKKYPDLHLLPGNELHYSPGCLCWLANRNCRTIGNTRYILVDFTADSAAEYIIHGLHQLLNRGFTPILAHTERYSSLHLSHLESLKRNGILFQLNADSFLSRRNFFQYRRASTILRKELADFVASDAHDTLLRPPHMTAAYHYLTQKYSIAYADFLCWHHAVSLFLPSDTERSKMWKQTIH